MWPVKSVPLKSKIVFLGFDRTSKSCGRSVRFWEGGRFVDLNMLRYHRDAPVVQSQLSMIAQFFSVVSRSPENIKCGGVVVDVV